MQTEQNNNFRPSLTLLNMSGDITLTWDDSNREAILELVRSKQRQGYSFFAIVPRFIPILGNKTVALKDERQLEKAVGIVVPDSQVSALLDELNTASTKTTEASVDQSNETAKSAPATTKTQSQKLRLVSSLDDSEVEAVVREGKAQLHLVPKGDLAMTHRVATAEEVLEHQTVAIRPISGG